MPAITPSQTVGPFFHVALVRSGQAVAAAPASVPRVTVEGVVRDGDRNPVGDALLEVWHADPEGRYPGGGPAGSRLAGFDGFVRDATDAEGRFSFDCVRPGPVPGPDGRLQAPHLVMAVFARGLLDRLYLRVYFPGEELNATCPILERVPAARRSTLVAVATGPGCYRFDVQLQGEDETVFFRC